MHYKLCLSGVRERLGRLTESWKTISEPHDREDYTKRWDWHAWQLFVALLPAAGRLSALYLTTRPGSIGGIAELALFWDLYELRGYEILIAFYSCKGG